MKAKKVNKSLKRAEKSQGVKTKIKKVHNPAQNLSVTSSTSKQSSIYFRKSMKNCRNLKEFLESKLKGSQFRYLNEKLYTSNEEGEDFKKELSQNADLFEKYHEGFRHQVSQWPVNPVDVIIGDIQKKFSEGKVTIADFGCGDALIAKTFNQHKVYSFDLVSTNELVTACDMKHTQLRRQCVDIAVFCLSLMGSNVSDYIAEANRVLKEGGLLKIAEVESRMSNAEEVISAISQHGFELVQHDFTHNLFYFLDLKKINNISKKRVKKLPPVSLTPCVYKKR